LSLREGVSDGLGGPERGRDGKCANLQLPGCPGIGDYPDDLHPVPRFIPPGAPDFNYLGHLRVAYFFFS